MYKKRAKDSKDHIQINARENERRRHDPAQPRDKQNECGHEQEPASSSYAAGNSRLNDLHHGGRRQG